MLPRIDVEHSLITSLAESLMSPSTLLVLNERIVPGMNDAVLKKSLWEDL